MQEEETSSLKRKQPASTTKQRSIRDFFKAPMLAQKHGKVRALAQSLTSVCQTSFQHFIVQQYVEVLIISWLNGR